MHHLEPEMDKAIQLSDRSLLGHKPKDPMLFLNGSAIYYGASGTGKTTAIHEQMYIMRHLFPKVVVFAPTNEQNHSFSGIVPHKLIHLKLSRKKLQSIFNDQMMISDLYKNVNNVDNLRDIFKEMRNHPVLSPIYYRAAETIKLKESQTAVLIQRIKTTDMSFTDKKKFEAEAITKLSDMILNIYKGSITENKELLLTSIKDEFKRTIIENISLNPNLLIILDDCVEHIKAIANSVKQRNGEHVPSIIDTIFMSGRHANITIIVSAQDDSLITVTMRRNNFISIFTDSECATHFMRNAANSISPKKRKRAELICDAIFSDTSSANHKKLVYYRMGNDSSKFTYMIADLYPSFKMCSETVWNMCNKLEESEKTKRKQFLVRFANSKQGAF